MIINEYRKIEIRELAEAISESYFRSQMANPKIVAADNNLTFSYGHYKDYFDGMLEHRFGSFHVFLNLDRLGSSDSPRARFTFAHELGHFFIDEHRNALRKGKVPSHPSFNKLLSKNIVEREADLFASCFLAPSKMFKSLCRTRPLDPNLIDELAKKFNISTSACIFRYFDLNLYPMILIFSRNGVIEWVMPTSDFRFTWPRRGRKVHSSSVAGEFFSNGRKYIDKQIVFPEDWFEDVLNKNQQLYEKCYYQSAEAVLSMIWVNEK
jgi:Zn-dependent peptidase ImmA (M78 family)